MLYPSKVCVLFVTLLAAQPVQGETSPLTASVFKALPICALSCFSSATSNSPCSTSNLTCACTNRSFQSEAYTCLYQTCTPKEILSTKNQTSVQCGQPIRNASAKNTVTTIFFAIVSGLAVLQRIASKAFDKLKFGLDDLFILLAAVTSIPLTVIVILGMKPNGLGRDVWTLKPDQFGEFMRFYFIFQTIYFAEVTLTKLALLFFYLRIFPGKLSRWVIWGSIAITAIFGIVFTLVGAFGQCRPMEYFWLRWDQEHQGKCIDTLAFLWANAVINIVLDLWAMTIPITQIRTLQLDWRKKMSVSAMFLVGIFVTAMSILRIHFIVKYGSHTSNPTWEYANASMWSILEVHVGIICNCMPTIRLLLLRILPRHGASTQKYSADGLGHSAQLSHQGSNRFGYTLTECTAGAHYSIRSSRRIMRLGEGSCDDQLELVGIKTVSENGLGA